jgi:hypothetical protein
MTVSCGCAREGDGITAFVGRERLVRSRRRWRTLRLTCSLHPTKSPTFEACVGRSIFGLKSFVIVADVYLLGECKFATFGMDTQYACKPQNALELSIVKTLIPDYIRF